MPQSETVQIHRERILRVLHHLQEHLDRDLSIDELARLASFSEFHFHRIFREIVGEPVAEHVRRLRLERAALELYYTERPIKQIAADVGYGSHEALTRAFVAQFAATPAEYRSRLAKPWGSTLEDSVFSPAETAGYDPFQINERIRKIEIVQVPPQRVAYMRSVGDYQTELAATWGRLFQWMLPRGMGGQHARKFNVPLDNPDVTPPEKQRADCCIEVDDDFQPEGEVGVQMLPGGTYAVAVHVGPWPLVRMAWHWIFNVWLPRSGHRFRQAPAYEVFWNPGDTPIEQWELHIHVPIEPAKVRTA
jgi:AraC family transcriptional regulator